MLRLLPLTATAMVAFGLLASPAAAQEVQSFEIALSEVPAATLEWSDIEVPGFLPGMKIVAIHGDASVPDEPYTLRLWLPDGYKFPPHFHPRAENVTVLEGTFFLAMGSEFNESELKTYGVGDYLYIAPENPHFGGAKGNTVLQLHGLGPFEIIVVEGQGMTP